jgi:GDPmannose 4,6-dehydratase
VREFVDLTFHLAGLDPDQHVVVDERYYRPQEVPHLQGDASKAKSVLGWKPRHTFEQLVKMMYLSDLARESK